MAVPSSKAVASLSIRFREISSCIKTAPQGQELYDSAVEPFGNGKCFPTLIPRSGPHDNRNQTEREAKNPLYKTDRLKNHRAHSVCNHEFSAAVLGSQTLSPILLHQPS